MLYLSQGGRCGICGHQLQTADQHVDHIIPVSRGGRDHIRNLRLVHAYCNTSPGNRLVAA
jgi:5-methylcytosine-specific restriction endonuclease McrA